MQYVLSVSLDNVLKVFFLISDIIYLHVIYLKTIISISENKKSRIFNENIIFNMK